MRLYPPHMGMHMLMTCLMVAARMLYMLCRLWNAGTPGIQIPEPVALWKAVGVDAANFSTSYTTTHFTFCT
jgi:hypothetical protein